MKRHSLDALDRLKKCRGARKAKDGGARLATIAIDEWLAFPACVTLCKVGEKAEMETTIGRADAGRSNRAAEWGCRRERRLRYPRALNIRDTMLVFVPLVLRTNRGFRRTRVGW